MENKSFEASVVYLISDKGKTKNYVEKVNQNGGEISVDFTADVNKAMPTDNEQELMKLVATPFIAAMLKRKKSEKEIFEWTQNNLGTQGVTVNITKEE